MTTITDRIGTMVEGMPDDAKIELTVGDVKRLVMLARSALILDAHCASLESARSRLIVVANRLRASESCAAAVIEGQICDANINAKWAGRELNRILGRTGPKETKAT